MLTPSRPIAPDWWTDDSARRAAALFAEGHTWEQIARDIGAPHPVHVRHLIRRVQHDRRVERELIRLAGGGAPPSNE